MEEKKTMNQLMSEIKEQTKKQKSASRVDEINVMKTMLNDPDFSVSEYHKSKGYLGKKCPREEAVKFISSIAVSLTGIDSKSATIAANNYEFTKKDAIFLLDNSKSFMQTYLDTGRKLPIVQDSKIEASIMTRDIESKEKATPGGRVTVPAYTKVVCRSRNPKYNTK